VKFLPQESSVASRNQSLDVLRGIAVLLVIVDHYSLVMNTGSPLLETLARGVDLFFVLSGLLISGLLFTEYKSTGDLNLKRFWIRRGFKIYPAFYVFLILTTAFVLADRFPIRVLLSEIFFLQSYLAHIFIHTWSLAVEEHFYFALPLLLLLLIRVSPNNKNPFRALPLISIAFSVGCLAMRMIATSHGEQFGVATHHRADALFAGVALGYYQHFDADSFCQARKLWVLIIGLLIALALLLMPMFLQYTFAYIGFACIVAWAVNQPPRSSSRRPAFALAFIGRHSYSIYLWHVVAVHWLMSAPPKWFRFPAYLGTAIVLGILMTKLVEFPALKLRDKFFPRQEAEGLLHQAPIPAKVSFVAQQ
jgi:peptidoglycan/LPS O-acetylase OafA/YrhL